MKIKILVVEDKETLNNNIVNILKLERYEVTGVFDYESARTTYKEFKPDIVLLDIMLPGGNGYDLINEFRSYKDAIIIMLTALDDIDTKKISYQSGADDYILKPFEIDELILKIGAVKRRILSTKRVIRIGDIMFDKDTKVISCNKKCELPRALYVVFSNLVENYLDKPDSSSIYIVDDIDKRSVQTTINRLRKELEYIGSQKIQIKTVYGKGYVLVVEDE